MIKTSTLFLEIDNFGSGKSGITDLKNLFQEKYDDVYAYLNQIVIPEISEKTIEKIRQFAQNF